MAAEEAWEFAVTIPAGTPAAAPVTVATVFPARQVASIRWRVPRGSVGLMGWRVTMGGQQVIPRAQGSWVVASGQDGVWELGNLPTSGAWDVTGYNTGIYPHTVYVTFLAAVIPRPPPLPAVTPSVLFMPVPDLSQAGPPVRPRP